MKGQGQFKRQTHCFSPIIVHIGVDQRCCADDVESSAILPTMSTHVTSSGVMDASSGKAHMRSGVVMDTAAFKVSHSVGIDKYATTLRAARARSSSIGAMDERSEKVQRCKHTLVVAVLSWILQPSK